MGGYLQMGFLEAGDTAFLCFLVHARTHEMWGRRQSYSPTTCCISEQVEESSAVT